VSDLVWCGPVRIHFCSPPRQRPDAATWPTARDVSQRAEPDIRPPGYAASAFIEDKARRLSNPLAGGVPPSHLMRPVHSAGGVPVHSTGRRHAHTVACTTPIIACTYQGSSRRISILCGLRTSGCLEIAQASLALVTPIVYSFHYAPGPTTIKGKAHNVIRQVHKTLRLTHRFFRHNLDAQTHTQVL
jgi:hypothetical protein